MAQENDRDQSDSKLTQSEKFIKAAETLGLKDSEASFVSRLKRIVGAKPAEKDGK